MDDRLIIGGIGSGDQPVRIFNDEGKAEFASRISNIFVQQEETYIDINLLNNDKLTKIISKDTIINIDKFISTNSDKPKRNRTSNKESSIAPSEESKNYPDFTHYEMMQYIDSIINLQDIKSEDIEGLSDWLMAYFIRFYLGNKKAPSCFATYGESKWSKSQALYRHLIFGPLKIYELSKEDVRLQLSNPSNVWGNRPEWMNFYPEIHHESTVKVIRKIFEEIEKESGNDTLKLGKIFSAKGYDKIYRDLILQLSSLSKNYYLGGVTEDELYEMIDEKFKGGIQKLDELQKVLK